MRRASRSIRRLHLLNHGPRRVHDALREARAPARVHDQRVRLGLHRREARARRAFPARQDVRPGQRARGLQESSGVYDVREIERLAR